MPPVVAAATAVATWIGGGTALAFVARTALQIAAAVAIGRLLAPGAGKIEAGSELTPSRNPAPPRKFIFGKTRTSGSILFFSTSGEKNKYFHHIVELAGHECEAIESLRFEDQALTVDGSGNVTSPSEFAGKVRIISRLGTDDNAFLTELGTDTSALATDGGRWVNDSGGLDDRLRGIAFGYIRLEWAEEFGGAIPPFSAVVKGAKVYDPRLDSTEGGSGDHRKDDPDTWEWTDNPALLTAFYLTFPKVRGGYGKPWSAINIDALAEAADDCEEFGYTCNGTFSTDVMPAEILRALLSSFAGLCPWEGGQFHILCGKYRAPVFQIDEDDFRGSIEITGTQPINQSFNEVRGVYASPEDDYQLVDMPPVRLSQALIDFEDAGVESSVDVSFPFTQDVEIAQKLAQIELKRNRIGLRCVVSCQLQAMQAASGDTIRVLSDRYKWFEDIESASDGFALETNDFTGLHSGGHGLSEGDAVRIDAAGIAPLEGNKRYYVRNPTTNRFELSLSRSGAIITFATDLGGGDWYQLQGKVFEVDKVMISNSQPPGVILELSETTPLIYDPDTPIIPSDHPTVNIPKLSDIETPQNLTVDTGTDQLYRKTDGTVVSRAKVSWDLSTDPFVLSGGFIEVQAKRSDSSVWVSEATAVGLSTHVLIWDVDDSGIRWDLVDDFPLPPYISLVSPVTNGTLVRLEPIPPFSLPSPLLTDTEYYIWEDPDSSGKYYLSTDDEGNNRITISQAGAQGGLVFVGYDFRVRFANSLGVRSPWAEVFDIRIIGKTQPPAVPASFSATDNADRSIVLTWTDPPDLDLSHIEIQRDFGTGYQELATVTRGRGNYIDRDVSAALAANTSRREYLYRIRGVDTSGNIGDWTSPATGKMADVTPPTISSLAQQDGKVRVRLTAPGIPDWGRLEVYVSTDGPTGQYERVGGVSPGSWPGLSVDAGTYPSSEVVYVRAFTIDTGGRIGTSNQADITIS